MEAPILRWSQRSFKNHSLVSENGCLGMHSGIRVFSYIACLRRSSSLFFIPLEPYPARFARHLPHAGKALSVDIVFLHVSCIRFVDARKAVSSYRCLPHWGRGTAPAVDRVLSYIVDLRRSFPLFFIPLSPSNLHPFGASPSIGRRECPREPLPLEGAAERSEAGLASFLAAKPPPSFLIQTNLSPQSMSAPPMG